MLSLASPAVQPHVSSLVAELTQPWCPFTPVPQGHLHPWVTSQGKAAFAPLLVGAGCGEEKVCKWQKYLLMTRGER